MTTYVGWPSPDALAGTADASALEQFAVLALFLLRLAGDPALAQVSGLPELLIVFTRTVIAAPFVFFVIAVIPLPASRVAADLVGRRTTSAGSGQDRRMERPLPQPDLDDQRA
jgi:hypothetical protein